MLRAERLWLAFAAIALFCGCAEARAAVVAGAIRWDAWHGGRSEVGRAVERSLAPDRWHARLPFFAKVLGPDRVRIDDANQGTMDREIAYARLAKLDYWAFLLYDEGSPMNLDLGWFLASKKKRGLRFCVIVEQDHWASAAIASRQMGRVAELMKRSEYLRVMGSRPVLFVLAAEPENRSWGASHAKAALSELRSLSPYVVVQDYRAGRAESLRADWSADAISAYAYQRDDVGASYSALASETERFWDECLATGSEVVPLVMTGWDRRPRVQRPVFWEKQDRGVGIDKYYGAPTPEELTRHVRDAVKLVETHPRAAPAMLILIYAWNENDEGGWIIPTFGEGDRRVRAVSAGLLE